MRRIRQWNGPVPASRQDCPRLRRALHVRRDHPPKELFGSQVIKAVVRRIPVDALDRQRRELLKGFTVSNAWRKLARITSRGRDKRIRETSPPGDPKFWQGILDQDLILEIEEDVLTRHRRPTVPELDTVRCRNRLRVRPTHEIVNKRSDILAVERTLRSPLTPAGKAIESVLIGAGLICQHCRRLLRVVERSIESHDPDILWIEFGIGGT